MFAGITPFTRSNIAALKSHIRTARPEFKSSHVDEALAFAFGFRTQAALLVALDQLGHTHLHAQANHLWFALRLKQLGYPGVNPDALREILWSATFDRDPDLSAREFEAATIFRPHPANDR
ncbi:hypothetical protein SAMN06295905_3552 [Devosia lucknowensis]|uniref:Uncharacterized protein n=1 Tax=Devosia lucknowensis TaxID=1096929 RepID=A0A1Y6GBY7_9HYPH|nr:hypothetical protein [Devosia lucknowensis]SMQ86248.1 hypothetical protein SAMN06295905_3552 [Devosia lucknowensis]